MRDAGGPGLGHGVWGAGYGVVRQNCSHNSSVRVLGLIACKLREIILAGFQGLRLLPLQNVFISVQGHRLGLGGEQYVAALG